MELEKTYPIIEGYYIEIVRVPQKFDNTEKEYFDRIIVKVSGKGDPNYFLTETKQGSIQAGVSFWKEYFTRDTITKIKRVCKLRIRRYNAVHEIEFILRKVYET